GASGGALVRGRGAGGACGREAAGGVCRAGGRLFTRVGRGMGGISGNEAAVVHASLGVRHAGTAAADAERQAGPRGASGACENGGPARAVAEDESGTATSADVGAD